MNSRRIGILFSEFVAESILTTACQTVFAIIISSSKDLQLANSFINLFLYVQHVSLCRYCRHLLDHPFECDKWICIKHLGGTWTMHACCAFYLYNYKKGSLCHRINEISKHKHMQMVWVCCRLIKHTQTNSPERENIQLFQCLDTTNCF